MKKLMECFNRGSIADVHQLQVWKYVMTCTMYKFQVKISSEKWKSRKLLEGLNTNQYPQPARGSISPVRIVLDEIPQVLLIINYLKRKSHASFNILEYQRYRVIGPTSAYLLIDCCRNFIFQIGNDRKASGKTVISRLKCICLCLNFKAPKIQSSYLNVAKSEKEIYVDNAMALETFVYNTGYEGIEVLELENMWGQIIYWSKAGLCYHVDGELIENV